MFSCWLTDIYIFIGNVYPIQPILSVLACDTNVGIWLYHKLFINLEEVTAHMMIR